MTYLSHAASFHSNERIAPSNRGIKHLVLRPGIPVSANIKTQDRNLFDYFFSPFVDAMSRAFRSE